MTAESGQLNSPEINNNGTSPISIRCHWTIMSENRTIELQILHMNLDFYTDYWCPHTSLKVNGRHYRVKSGIFGQTAKFGQPPCLFHSSIIGIEYKLTKQTVNILMRRLIRSPHLNFQCLQMYFRFQPMSEISRLYSTL